MSRQGSDSKVALLIRFQQLVMRRREVLIGIKSHLRAWKVRDSSCIFKGWWTGKGERRIPAPKIFINIRRQRDHSDFWHKNAI